MARIETRVSVSGLKRQITIVGGGLAGLSLGIALRRRDVPVTVIEAGSYPRHRVCGEFISGVTRETLESLGIEQVFEGAVAPRTLAWYDHDRVVHRDELPEPAIGLSRHALDDRLQRMFTSHGGVLRSGERAKPAPADGHVWAAGRKPQPGSWIGLKAHVRGVSPSADLEMHVGSNGYAGVSTVEDGWWNVCGLFRIDKDLARRDGRMLLAYLSAGGNTKLAERLSEAEWRDGSECAVAGFRLGRQRPLRGLPCIGDAESMIPPFTGNGMSMAFEAAETACPWLASWHAGQSSWRDVSEEIRISLRKRFHRRLSAAMWLHRGFFSAPVRELVRALSKEGLLPFRPMLSLVR
ncbi:MAG: FAD-dependent monooxygenase [Verrucomicrobiae bacterium]|nr:FAD-dependent monooxygenase [Verrucomicrobiae bacterium]